MVDGESPYLLQFDRDKGLEQDLGFLVSNHLLRKALYERVSGCENIQLLTGTTAKSVVAGRDGAQVNLSNEEMVNASADSRKSAEIQVSRHPCTISAGLPSCAE